ncbi:MAG: MBL fold metallo-hydrolase [Thermoplasmata archaeon]
MSGLRKEMVLKKEYNNNIEEIKPELFKIQIPLPDSPLRFVNSYLIKGAKRSLVIDTGLNLKECYEAMIKALDELDVKLDNTDFFITHMHSDHIGLISKLAATATVYLSNVEHKIVFEYANSSTYWLEINKYMDKNGFPESELNSAFKILNNMFVKTYPISDEFKKINFKALNDKDILNYGTFRLEAVLTPGHSPGHMCLYEPDKKMLFSGDHLLFDITPNITWWPSLDNSLKNYLESLDKIYDLDIELVLPGHGKLGFDHRKRINEIKNHHKIRLDEILLAIKEGKKTAYEIAGSISWNLKAGGWKSFPETQKYFAVGETIAHLIYLEREKLIRSMLTDQTIYYEQA